MKDFPRDVRAYSKLEWISFILVTLCMLSFLIPEIIQWRKRTKTREAINNIQIIYDAQQKHFAKQLEANPSGATYLALPMTPNTTSSKKQTADFNQDPWSTLKLPIDSQVLFTYEVTVSGVGPKSYFDVYARGDLDGDGNYSIHKIRGSVDPNGNPMGKETIYKMDPLE